MDGPHIAGKTIKGLLKNTGQQIRSLAVVDAR
jgi:hypothetical protein